MRFSTWREPRRFKARASDRDGSPHRLHRARIEMRDLEQAVDDLAHLFDAAVDALGRHRDLPR